MRGQLVGHGLTRHVGTSSLQRLGQREVVDHDAGVDTRVVSHIGPTQVAARGLRGEGHLRLLSSRRRRNRVRVRQVGRRAVARDPTSVGRSEEGRRTCRARRRRDVEADDVSRARQQVGEPVVTRRVRQHRGADDRRAVRGIQGDRGAHNGSLARVLQTITVHIDPHVVTDRDLLDLQRCLGVVVGPTVGVPVLADRRPQRDRLRPVSASRRDVGDVVRRVGEGGVDGRGHRDR
ncbi:MAG: hypothetical protein BWY91_00801 [bacterium ADurb.BinA028]|nr:MAG: hypothetical protein BWY91_00801 [bacterium ADurb.BinA028]